MNRKQVVVDWQNVLMAMMHRATEWDEVAPMLERLLASLGYDASVEITLRDQSVLRNVKAVIPGFVLECELFLASRVSESRSDDTRVSEI